MKRIVVILFVTTLVVTTLTTTVWAQATAQISGTVKDQSGAVVPNAAVTVTKTETNVARSTTANTSGVYSFPNLVPDRPDAPGAALSREARNWLSAMWSGQSFMAIGMKDPVLGPSVMSALHAHIRGCPPPLQVPEAGHFVQEWGAPIAAAALAQFQLN